MRGLTLQLSTPTVSLEDSPRVRMPCGSPESGRGGALHLRSSFWTSHGVFIDRLAVGAAKSVGDVPMQPQELPCVTVIVTSSEDV